MNKKDRLPIFRERFTSLLNSSDMSRTEFATKLGLSRQTVGFYLNGDRIPDAEGLLSLAESCGVSSDWLLGLSEASDRNETVQQISKCTGLSESAISILHRMNTISNNGPLPKEFGKQYIRLYSAFICNLKVMGMTQTAIPNILRIRENGLSETEEDIFNNPSEAISFYTFQMQNVILDFLQDYFKDEIVDDPFTE